MRIKKTFQTTVPTGKVLNSHTESDVDVYSCNYVNGLETYSTNETRVGTWMNKPLYRKVLTGTLPAGSGSNDFYLDTDAEVRKVSGFVKSIYSQWWSIPCTYSSASYNIYLIVDGTVSGDSPINKISIECGSYYNTSSKYFIIVEYTKTTD